VAKASSHSAKNTFRWRYLMSVVQDLRLDELQEQAHKLLATQRGMGSTGWLVVALGGFALLYWNGRLFVATGAGVAVMLLVYLLHGWQPAFDWAKVRRWTRQTLRGWNQPFVVSAGAGTIATVAVYLAAVLYAEAANGWVASAALLQGLGTIAVLILLIKQRLHPEPSRDRTLEFDQVLQALTHSDPLKRLIAVRQLTDWVAVLDDADRQGATSYSATNLSGTNPTATNPSGKQSRRAIADYLRVLLSREKHPLVRDAVLDGLQTLDIVHQLQAATQPLLKLDPRQNLALRHKVPVKAGRSHSKDSPTDRTAKALGKVR
jgi:hypothetical protein